MSVTRTFTVTVVSTGSGNKYFIDGTQTPTLELVEGATFRFDQSDSSNATHPLRFATAADAAGGTQYTTNVTTNGTPGASGAYTQIEVASSAPTLYYYCTNHGGMGGQANTPNSDFWGAGNWSANLWGIEEAFNVGWGAQVWNDRDWGELNDINLTLTGVSTTTAIGSVSVTAEINTGWGQDGWGVENWGQSGQTVVIVSGVQATTGIGEDVSWGKQTWGSATTGWGGEYYLEVANVMGLTGIGTTSSVGSPTAISNFTGTLTGVSATSSIGTIDPADQVMGLTGLSATSSIGTIDPADQVMGLTGLEATTTLGEPITSQNPIVDLTGVSMTASTGNLDPADQVMGLTGVLATASVGTIDPADQVMGLTGVSATASVSPIGVAPLGYERVTATQTANYTSVNAGN